MVVAEAGSIAIVGTIDVTSIQYGLRQMKNGLDSAKTSARGAFGDLKRIGDSVAGLAGPLGIAGLSIASLFMGLAAMAPNIAPILAEMEINFMRLVMILGQQLEPVFKFAGKAFSDFVDFIDKNQGAIGELANRLVNATNEAGKLADTISKDLNKALEENKPLLEAMGKGLTAGLSKNFEDIKSIIEPNLPLIKQIKELYTGEKTIKFIIETTGLENLAKLVEFLTTSPLHQMITSYRKLKEVIQTEIEPKVENRENVPVGVAVWEDFFHWLMSQINIGNSFAVNEAPGYMNMLYSHTGGST